MVGNHLKEVKKELETSKIIISRSDTNLIPVTKGELLVLLDQLNNVEELANTNISCDFLKEVLRMAIDSFAN